MLEIEQKYAGVDFDAIRKQLAEWGVSDWSEHEEADHYLNAPDRDFAQTNEAFRLRRIGEENYLTYKGRRLDPNVKIRPELELQIQSGAKAVDDMLQLFDHLGYRRVAIVRKRRRQARLEREGFRVTVCLDEVETVGRFAEVEIVAVEENLERARAVLLEIAAELGLAQVEQRSYLSMHLARRDQK